MEGLKGIIEVLKKNNLGLSELKSIGFSFVSNLDDPNKIVIRKAYKAASIWIKLDTDMNYITQQFPKLIKK